MKIYTKTGDEGKTSLFGGKRVWKDDLRLHAYGTIDELNSVLGIASGEIKSEELREIIGSIQNDLFTLGSDLATPLGKDTKDFAIPRVDENFIFRLEKFIDNYDNRLPELKNFILPGGTKGASYLHFARTICRRAERETVALGKSVDIGDKIVIYLNRLSDLLFVLARYDNSRNGTPDIHWLR
ncbi:MAG: cob(I)yrinic acid a,c-diamide adenosyltransferase [Ignavibacteriales bacterium]|nr:cob(I)yrinic acid a,c-diamide adenosyltransferase [Ignavibacteriales bacterium]